MTTTRRFYFATAMAMLMIGCQEEPMVEQTRFSEVIPFETIGIGQRGDFSEPTERMVYEEASWTALSASLRPLADFETVDFSQVMLAVIAIPVKSGGYTIEVESAELLDSVLTISYVMSEPGFDCITPPALAVPFQVIELRKTEAPVRFERRTERFRCEDF